MYFHCAISYWFIKEIIATLLDLYFMYVLYFCRAWLTIQISAEQLKCLATKEKLIMKIERSSYNRQRQMADNDRHQI